MKTKLAMDENLAKAAREAGAREEVRQAVEAVYGDLKQQIEARKPICRLSGRCCHFEEFGHRMYLTTMELGFSLHNLPPFEALPEALKTSIRNWDGRGCPFQVGKLCGVHDIRPLGCRIFFCDESSTEWQSGQSERLLGELKRLHETLGVPYRYVEWRAGLGALEAVWRPAKDFGKGLSSL